MRNKVVPMRWTLSNPQCIQMAQKNDNIAMLDVFLQIASINLVSFKFICKPQFEVQNDLQFADTNKLYICCSIGPKQGEET